MADSGPAVPAIVRHYAAYLRAKSQITPEISMTAGKADVRISNGEKLLVLIFGCRKQEWSLRSVEVRRGDQTRNFIRGELAKAVAALLHPEAAPLQHAVPGSVGCGPVPGGAAAGRPLAGGAVAGRPVTGGPATGGPATGAPALGYVRDARSPN